MKSYKNVDEYIHNNKTHQDKLLEIRNLIKETVPKAIEKIAYGMPAYIYHDKPLFYFAAMKGHLGIYPTPTPIIECAQILEGFSTSKGCVRIPYTKEVPKKIIVQLLKSRVREIKTLIK